MAPSPAAAKMWGEDENGGGIVPSGHTHQVSELFERSSSVVSNDDDALPPPKQLDHSHSGSAKEAKDLFEHPKEFHRDGEDSPHGRRTTIVGQIQTAKVAEEEAARMEEETRRNRLMKRGYQGVDLNKLGQR